MAGVKTHAERVGLEPALFDIGDARIGEPIADLAALADGSKQHPGGDPGRVAPSPHRDAREGPGDR